eukprot:gene9051-1369_t
MTKNNEKDFDKESGVDNFRKRRRAGTAAEASWISSYRLK